MSLISAAGFHRVSLIAQSPRGVADTTAHEAAAAATPARTAKH